MQFSDAIQTVFQKYAVFEGRAGRPEYWYWVLFTVLVSIAANILGEVIGVTGNALGALFSLATLVPSIAVGVRRLHDTGRSGWNLLWGVIPLLGWVVVLYFTVQPSEAGTNRFGPQPGVAPLEV